MKLIIDAIRWIASHLISVGVLICVLFGLHLVVNVLLPQWKLDLDRLSQEVLRLESRRDDLNSELSLRRARVKKARARVDAIRSRYSAAVQSGIEALGRSEEVVADRVRELNKHASIHATAVQSKISACNGFCGRLYGFYDRTLGSGRCDKLSSNCRDATAFARALGKNAATYQKRLEQARRLVDRARMNLEQLRAALPPEESRRLAEATSVLFAGRRGLSLTEKARHEVETDLISARATRTSTPMRRFQHNLGEVEEEWALVKWRLMGIVALVILGPLIWRVFWYFVLMPLFSRSAPLRLESEDLPGGASLGPARHSLEISLGAGECLAARADWLVAVGDEAEGRARRQTRLFWSWRAPFVSYAARLTLLTEVRGEAENRGEPAALAILAPPRDPDLCICRLDLKDDHPGFVIHPRHVVGVQGDVKLRASWRLFNFHAWATQQVRYICFSGEGAVYLTGHGGLFAADASGVRLRLDEKVVVGFDARLAYSARRTETFVPYLLGRTSLVDDSFTGEGLILREAVSGVPSGGTLVERGLQGLITAVGKFFGF